MRTAVVRVLVLVSIAACSGLGPEPETVEPPRRAAAAPPPEQQSPVQAPTPAPAPEPAPAASVTPAPAPAPAPAEPANELNIPGGPAFHCAERQSRVAKPGDKNPEYVGECYRLESTCESRIAEMRKLKAHWTPCRARERAVCFLYTNIAEHGMAFRCFDAERGCEVERASFQKQYPKGEFSDCKWTTQNELRVRSRAVARAGTW